jgi:hypothetical protein
MTVVDVSNVSLSLFVTGIIFILLIGSFFSLGVLRFFQLRKKQGVLYLGLACLMFVGLIYTVNTWFL